MRFDKTNGKSFEFIDNVDFGTHSILLYEKEDDCMITQFRWLQNGMKKYQYGLFLTHEDPSTIENKMYDFGIDVDTHGGSLLDVIQIPDMRGDSHSIMTQNENFMKKVLRGRGPCRITGRTLLNIDSAEAKQVELDIEEKVHAEFDRSDLAFLCPYNVNKIKDKTESMWAKQTIQSHDNVVFVPQ